MRSVPRLLSAYVLVVFAIALLKTVSARSTSAHSSAKHPLGTVVYVLNGDLYTRELPDGAIHRLTWDGGNSEPHWSPSGYWIVFVHEKHLCFVPRDGSSRHSIGGNGWWSQYSFSPISDEIAFITDDQSLLVSSLGGRKLRYIFRATEGNKVFGVSWSPDGHSIAYSIENYGTYDIDGKTDFRISLWCTNASGTGKPHLLYVSRGHEAAPEIAKWSSDSRYLLFWALHETPGSSVNADGLPLYVCQVGHPNSRPRRLFGKNDTEEVLDEPDFIGIPRKSNHVAISVGDERFWVVNKRIALVDLRSYSTQLVTPSSLAAICPTWSPDGKRIAYLAAPSRAKGESISDAVRRMSLWIMNADGTHQKRLEIGPVADDMGPRWVGDGHYLLFERIQEGPDQDIRSLWMIGVNGQGQRCIVPHIGIDDEEWRSNHFDVWLPQK